MQHVRIKAPLAFFGRPEFKAEGVSYPFPTPSAARGMLDSIYRHRGMRWRVVQIDVLETIRWVSMRINEVSAKATFASAKLGYVVEEHRTPRHRLMLRDVDYIVHAEIDLVPEGMNPGDSLEKFEEMAQSRIETGHPYKPVTLGLANLFGEIYPIDGAPAPIQHDEDFGNMFWDWDRADPKKWKPLPFRAKMAHGRVPIPADPERSVRAPRASSGSLLNSLYSLAEKLGLVDSPTAVEKVSWVLSLDEQGNLIEAIEQKDAKGKRGILMTIPRPARPRGTRVAASLLSGNSKYIFGVDPEGREKPERLLLQKQAFLDQAKACWSETRDEGVSALLLYLATGKLPETYTASDRIVFSLRGELIHERPKVKAYWGEKASTQETEEVFCWIANERLPRVKNHPPVKLLGTNPAGSPLVAFNTSAFWSHGLTGNENFQCSQRAANGIGDALNYLLRTLPKEKGKGRVFDGAQRCVCIADDTVLVYWADEYDHPFVRELEKVLEGQVDTVPPHMAEMMCGKGPEEMDPTPFHAAILSGNSGRVIVRRWLSTTVGQAMKNLATHYRDMGTMAAKVPLRALLSAAERSGTRKQPPELRVCLVWAMLAQDLYPIVLCTLLRALLKEEAKSPAYRAWKEEARYRTQVALLQATLTRKEREHVG